MNNENIVSGNTEEEIWQQINEQFTNNPEPLEYAVVVLQATKKIAIDIDIDLGGGFESGYETTTFTSPVKASSDF